MRRAAARSDEWAQHFSNASCLTESLFRRFTDIQTYTDPVPLKYGKLATEYPWIYGYFLQCILVVVRLADVSK